MISITLPWPPSVNSMYRNVVIGVRPRTLLSAKGRAYKAEATMMTKAAMMGQHGFSEGHLSCRIDLFPPDKRKRDIDNHGGKAVLDVLTDAGVFDDDSQIKSLHVVMHEPDKANPRAEVEVSRL